MNARTARTAAMGGLPSSPPPLPRRGPARPEEPPVFLTGGRREALAGTAPIERLRAAREGDHRADRDCSPHEHHHGVATGLAQKNGPVAGPWSAARFARRRPTRRPRQGVHAVVTVRARSWLCCREDTISSVR